MFGLLLCWLFKIHDWKMFRKVDDDGIVNYLFICPRCRSHQTYTVSIWKKEAPSQNMPEVSGADDGKIGNQK